MQDKDKIILVAYVNIGGINERDASEALIEISKALCFFDNSVMPLVVPVREEETRIECINPQLVSEEKYKEAEEAVERLKKVVGEMK